MIERAEYVLRDHGFHDVRVRHHQLSDGHLARIELGPTEIARIFEISADTGQPRFERVASELRQIGYAHVTLDLQGYRRGSLNEARK